MNYALAYLLKKKSLGFTIVAIYVDNMNIIGALDELRETAEYLKSKFEMKNLGKTLFCLGLELEYHDNVILIHQSTYTQQMFRHFNIDKLYLVNITMSSHSLDPRMDLFYPMNDGEEVLEAEVSYISSISALLYLV